MIGSRRRNIPPPVTRLALIGGISLPPSRDWLSSEKFLRVRRNRPRIVGGRVELSNGRVA
eukprot:1189007-Prorocentrum_minimum.AAC.3